MQTEIKFPPKTMQIFRYIDKHHVDTGRIEEKFGDTCHFRLKELRNAHVINYEFEEDGVTHVIVPSLEGVYFLENYRAERFLTTRERWLERLYGFISGALVTIISGLILGWLAG